MTLDTEQYQDHIRWLAKDLDCLVQQAPGMAGMMFVEEHPPRVQGPTLGSLGYYGTLMTESENIETSYLVLLHELGHVAHGHTQGRPPYRDQHFYFDNGVLNSETDAWDWALSKMRLASLQPATVRCIRDKFLGSYHAAALRVGLHTPGQVLMNGNRHWVKFAYGDDTTTRAMKRRMTTLTTKERVAA